MKKYLFLIGILFQSVAFAAINGTNLEFSTSSTDATEYPTAIVTPATNSLTTITVVSRKAAGDPGTPWAQGCAMTWVTHDSVLIASNRRLTVFRSLNAVTSPDSVSIRFAATQTHALWSIDQFTNVDTTGSNGSGAIGNSPTATTGATSPSSISLSAIQNSNSVAFGAQGKDGTGAVAPGSGFTELAETAQAENTAGLQTEYQRNVTDITTTFSNTNWAAIGFEIKSNEAATDTGDFFLEV